jgi:hypothetical protein
MSKSAKCAFVYSQFVIGAKIDRQGYTVVEAKKQTDTLDASLEQLGNSQMSVYN